MAFPDIYLLTEEIHHGPGKRKGKVFKPINAVVSSYQEEDANTGQMKQILALFHSNNLVATPEEIVSVYKQRWSVLSASFCYAHLFLRNVDFTAISLAS